jgi:hypothetical protein
MQDEIRFLQFRFPSIYSQSTSSSPGVELGSRLLFSSLPSRVPT